MSSDRPREVSFPNRIRVRLSRRDRDLILKHTFIGGDVEERIRVARANGTAIMVDLTPDDIDELLGYVAAEANHSEQPVIRRQLYALYDRLTAVEVTQARRSEAAGASASGSGRSRPHRFTRKQGQYLALIYYYTKIHGRAPAEADLQQYFKVSPPAVHQMVLTLEGRGLITREPGKPRSIRLLVERHQLPDLE